MKKIIVSIPNALLAGGVVMYLKKNPDFKVYREDNPSGIEDLCIASKADVLLAEVRERPPHTLDEWNIRVKAIKKGLPDCKAVYVVDENALPSWPTKWHLPAATDSSTLSSMARFRANM